MISTVKYGEHHLKTKITHELIQTRNLYYTLCKKSATNISIMSNWRLLIFDLQQCIIYYVNKDGTSYVPPPFNTIQNIPPPKNDVVFIPLSVIKNPNSSKDLSIQFNKKNAKGQNVSGEWIFTMENQKMAREWVQMIRTQKKERANKALGIKSGQGQIVQDSLAFGMLAGLKKQNAQNEDKKNEGNKEKQEEKKKLELGNFVMTQSKKEEKKEDSNNKQKNNNPTNSDLQKSNANKNDLSNSKANNNLSNSNLGNSKADKNLSNSNLGNSKADKNISNSNLGNSKAYNNLSNSNLGNSKTDKNIGNIKGNNNMSTSNLGNSKADNKMGSKANNTSQSGINNMGYSNIKQSNVSNSNSEINPTNPHNMGNSNSKNKSVHKIQQGDRQYEIPLSSSRYNHTYMPVNKNNSNQRGGKDWNLQFLQNPNEHTISQFNIQVRQLLNLIPLESLLQTYRSYHQEVSNLEYIQPIQIQSDDNIVFYCSVEDSRAAHLLQCQFHNYHFILESSKNYVNRSIHVPLTALIKFMGVTILAKAIVGGNDASNNNSRRVHNKREIVYQLRQLQKMTKISSKVLESQANSESCAFYDLTTFYYNQGQQCEENRRIIFMDKLREYLPYYPTSLPENKPSQLVRPELIYNLNSSHSYLHPEDIRTATMLNKANDHYIGQLAELLSNHDQIITSYSQLEQLMNEYGLTTFNDKILTDLYHKLTNKMPKKYVHGVMVGKLISMTVWQALKEQILVYTQQQSTSKTEKQIQNQIKNLLTEQLQIIFESGSNTAISAQAWRQLSLKFKKNYKFVLNTSEVCQEGGFLLATVMEILPLDFSLKNFDKERVMFSEGRILGKQFVKNVGFKFMGYDRFRTENVDRVLTLICQPLNSKSNKLVDRKRRKKNLNNSDMEQIKKVLQGEDGCHSLILNQSTRAKILAALSSFVPPKSVFCEGNINELQQIYERQIYQKVNEEPPNSYSHLITINYLRHMLKSNNQEAFKLVVESYIENLGYWLGDEHFYLCEVYELLSDYYGLRHHTEDSINFVKQSLTTCIRAGGTHTRQAGSKYYLLAEKLLKNGYKNQAKSNFEKAQVNMQGFTQDQNLRSMSKEYPLVLMKLGIIALSEGENDQCIRNSINAINIMSEVQQLGDSDFDDVILMKNYELLCRAYEINGSKGQLKNLAAVCGKVFNNTKNLYVFDQMMRISLTGILLNLQPIKQTKFAQYLGYLKKGSRRERINKNDCIGELMEKANHENIMERIHHRLENIDRCLTEKKTNRLQSQEGRETKWMVERIVGTVGMDFLEGILTQCTYAGV